MDYFYSGGVKVLNASEDAVKPNYEHLIGLSTHVDTILDFRFVEFILR